MAIAKEVPANSSLEETVPPKLNLPFNVITDNTPDDLKKTIAAQQRNWLGNVMSSMRGIPSLLPYVDNTVLTPERAVLTRIMLSAAHASAMNVTQMIDAIHDITPIAEGAVARIIVASQSDDETPDEDDVFRLTTTNRLSKIEESIARIEKLAKQAASTPKNKNTPGPTAPGIPAPTGKPLPAAAPASYASAAATQTENTRKFNPSPNQPSAFRKKVRDPLEHGELLFAPLSPLTRDGNAGRIDGINGLNLVNGELAQKTPKCSIKGIRWTPRGNVLLTPSTPEEWDILAKHGPSILEHLCGVKFALRTTIPSKNLVLHGWPASHEKLPNIADVCQSLATGLKINSADFIQENTRWLSGPKSNKNHPPLLLLAVATDEVADHLLYNNPHWVLGKKLSFKKFSTPPTIPNQCNRCWKVGHPTWRCSVKTAVCGVCAKDHATVKHKCPTRACRITGKKCDHASYSCPICSQEHPAWDRDCQERQIQRTAHPPKKPRVAPKATAAAPDSPVRKAANLIRSFTRDHIARP
ncbi:hypothetical protein BOTBODRAFT_180317 [Botryobasidium botryosum FD-172 SS1]|uniref:Uncharacterized protein n=1 Tax=Botryobasidium botryosum (strain FD-172 SS1) TaxID=930990 RepID=A0A067LWX2_BOTB1|nr:hypothetical protein BOTBODRAFT_180317 [Botryobasidium botryosum FD-172 SS1]